MKAPRKPAATVMGLRPETDEMVCVTPETLQQNFSMRKNGANRY